MPIEVGIIGFGTHGSQFFEPALRASQPAKVVAVVDINPAARNKAEERGLAAYESPAGMLACHDGIGYVAIAVPHHQSNHVINSLAEAAVKRNLKLTVTTEKPIATDLKTAWGAISTLKQAFKFAAVFNRFSYPPFQYGLEQITAGVLGPIDRIHDEIIISGPPPLLDPWTHLPDPKNPSDTRGNALLNGFHSASILALLGGLPESVSATIQRQSLYPGTEVDDTVTASANYPHLETSYRCQWGAIPDITVATQFIGTNGQLIVQQWGDTYQSSPNSKEWTKQSFERKDEFAAKHDSGNRLFHEAILAWMLNESVPLPHPIEHALQLGLVSQTIVETSYLSSARGGKPVTPEEVVDGIIPIGELQTIAALAKLPMQKSI